MCPICDDYLGYPNTVGWCNTSSRNQMGHLTSSRCTLVAKPGVLLLDLLNRKTSSSSRSRLPLVLGALGVRLLLHTGLWARPRPGTPGGALVIPRGIWPGLCSLPRNFRGWPATESCLHEPAYCHQPPAPSMQRMGCRGPPRRSPFKLLNADGPGNYFTCIGIFVFALELSQVLAGGVTPGSRFPTPSERRLTRAPAH